MNPLRRKVLDRRTLLRGAGVLLALPLLDAMVPAVAWAGDGAAAAAAAPPRRFVGMMTNMGILPDNFFPKETGRRLHRPALPGAARGPPQGPHRDLRRVAARRRRRPRRGDAPS